MAQAAIDVCEYYGLLTPTSSGCNIYPRLQQAADLLDQDIWEVAFVLFVIQLVKKQLPPEILSRILTMLSWKDMVTVAILSPEVLEFAQTWCEFPLHQVVMRRHNPNEYIGTPWMVGSVGLERTFEAIGRPRIDRLLLQAGQLVNELIEMSFGGERGITIGVVEVSFFINHVITLHHPIKAIVAQIINHKFLRFFVVSRSVFNAPLHSKPSMKYEQTILNFTPDDADCEFANGSWSLDGTYFAIFQRRIVTNANGSINYTIKLIIFKKVINVMRKMAMIDFENFLDCNHLSERLWVSDNVLYVPVKGLLQKIEISTSDLLVITPANECIAIESLYNLYYVENFTLKAFDVRLSHIYRLLQPVTRPTSFQPYPIYFKRYKGQIYVITFYLCANPVHLHHIMTLFNLQHLEWQLENPLNCAYMRRAELSGLVTHVDFSDDKIVVMIAKSRYIEYLRLNVELAINKPHDGFRADCSLVPYFTSPYDTEDATTVRQLQIDVISMADWTHKGNLLGNASSFAHLSLDCELNPFSRKNPQTIVTNDHSLTVTCMKNDAVFQAKAYLNYPTSTLSKELAELDCPWLTQNAKGSFLMMCASNSFIFSLRSFTTPSEQKELFDYNL